MIIGIPKEIKPQENRVGLNPQSVKEVIKHGHTVIVETDAGKGIGACNSQYTDVGAMVVDTPNDVFQKAEMIIKVKEPQKSEYSRLKSNQILFTYLHLAADKDQALGLMESGCTAIAYETVTEQNGGGLPLLRPMSEIAGSMAPLMGAVYSASHFGGQGLLASGVTGVKGANVLILGGGVSGFAAAKIAHGIGAAITITDMNDDRIRFLNDSFDERFHAIRADEYVLHDHIGEFDMIIGAVLIPGASAPRLVTRNMLPLMKKGAMLVDIAIDQGGCFETSRPTTHDNPVYKIDGVMHYCVANMPGAYPLTSTAALNKATLPYIIEIANKGLDKALVDNPCLADGINVREGEIVHDAVKQDIFS
jgi:alanine dehydrogenase